MVLRFEMIGRVGVLATFAALAGCATPDVPTDVATTGMPNAELALRRSIDQTDAALTRIGTMRTADVHTSVSAGKPISLLPAASTAATTPIRPVTLAVSTVSTRPPVSAPAPAPASVTVSAPVPGPIAVSGPVAASGLQVVPDALQKPIQFTWTGPLDGGVRKLGKSIGYSVAVIAPPNAHPVPVSVAVQGQVIGVLRTLGQQAGSEATVEVDPLRHVIQVIHHV